MLQLAVMLSSTAKAPVLKGIISSSTYPSGALKSCIVNQPNMIETAVGDLVPQFSNPEFGERQKKYRSSVDFFENGQIKSIALDQQTLLKTTIGNIKAELVTFYEDGAINRIFPLNGKIDGFWSEANERSMAESFDLELPVGRFSAKVIGIHFYRSGRLKSLTIWPGQRLTLATPLGSIDCRAGFSLYENGSVRSLEPMFPIELPTPVGLIRVFDPEIIGMHADVNSVQFNESGELSSVKTIHTGVRAIGNDCSELVFEPFDSESFIDPSKLRTVPMTVEFSEKYVRIVLREPRELAYSDFRFETFERARVLRDTCEGCPGDETCCQNGGEGVGDGGCCGGGGCSNC